MHGKMLARAAGCRATAVVVVAVAVDADGGSSNADDWGEYSTASNGEMVTKAMTVVILV